MVVSGFYNLHGVFVTEDERQRLMKDGWADAEEPLPGEDFIRCAKDSRCHLIQIPHGFEDLEEYEDKWFFGVGDHIYFGPVENDGNSDDGQTSEYADYKAMDLFNIINSFIKFKETPKQWYIPSDCPCCS